MVNYRGNILDVLKKGAALSTPEIAEQVNFNHWDREVYKQVTKELHRMFIDGLVQKRKVGIKNYWRLNQ